jgi:hypothetical protein
MTLGRHPRATGAAAPVPTATGAAAPAPTATGGRR